MNPITHALAGWCLAETVSGIEDRERAAIVLASVGPDLDGFGLLVELATRDTDRPLLWWSEYHHTLGHNLLFALVVTAVVAAFSRRRRVVVAAVASLAFHLHLLCDLAGSRGPDGYEWPIPYLHPFFDRPQFSWSGQWALNAWPNIVLTILLLFVTFALAWRRGYSPLRLVSSRADRAFIHAIRNRFH